MAPGKARLVSAIPDTAAGYPEDFDYKKDSRTLRVGSGEVAPVDPAVYDYSVSGYEVLKNFLSHRRKEPSGRTSSPLDKVWPSRWSRPMTDELLELIWLLEATVENEPRLVAFLEDVVASELFAASDLPQPTDEERGSPKGAEEEADPYQLSFYTFAVMLPGVLSRNGAYCVSYSAAHRTPSVFKAAVRRCILSYCSTRYRIYPYAL